MRRSLLESIADKFVKQDILTSFQIRGAFANYANLLKADFKSIAASGWGPELIPDDEILQSQFPEVLEDIEKAQARLAELQALFAAADEEDFEDTDDTGVLPGEEVKTKKEELKEQNAKWKAQLKEVKALAGNIFTEIKAAGLLPKGAKKAYYCTEGFTLNDAMFDNGQRVIDLAKEVRHKSEYAVQLSEAMEQGKLAKQQAIEIEQSLAKHKELEDEVKSLRALIKSTENKRDELVENARMKITTGEAQTVIVARLKLLLMDTYQAYLRADLRNCMKAIENLFEKYFVTAREIEIELDAASKQLNKFLMGLGYE
jgi:type I restriction enzyme M protein